MKRAFRQGIIVLLALSSCAVMAAALRLPAPASTAANTDLRAAPAADDSTQPEAQIKQTLDNLELGPPKSVASLGKKPIKLSDYLPKGNPYSEYAASTARQPKLLVKYSRLTPSDVPHPLTPNWASRYVQKNLPTREDINGIPQPIYTGGKQKILSLNDAILLALRNNPAVVSAKLQRITDKYALEVAENQYSFLYPNDFSLTSKISKDGKPTYGLGSLAVNMKTRYGTDATLTYNGTDFTGAKSPGGFLDIKQNLLKGLSISNFIYYAAVDAELAARLTYFAAITDNVNTIITDYRTLLSTKMNIDNDTVNTKNYEVELAQAKLKYKAGTASVNDVLQAASNLTQQQSKVITDQLQYQTDYQTLLTALGLSPASNFKIVTDVQIDPQDEQIPDLKTCIETTLKNNTQYLQQVLAMRATQRAVESARDARKWSLDLTVHHEFGVGPPQGDGAQAGSPGSNASLTLGFPINYLTVNNTLVSMRITYETAKLKLLQTKEAAVALVMTDYNAVINGRINLKLNEETLKQQTLTLQQNLLRYQYGKSSSLEYSQAVESFRASQAALVTAKITYLNAITALRVEMDTLLKHYHIKLRY